ncbi:MAG: DUF998 domain-containing protein [Steroidobacteraceae bacterium]
MFGLLYFVAVVLVLHLVRGDVNPAQHFLSEYAIGRHGALMASAFVGFGLGAICLAFGLYQYPAIGTRSKTGSILLAAFGVLTFLAALFTTDPRGAALTTVGIVHIAAGLLSFIALMPAMILVSRRLRNDPRKQFSHRLLLVVSLIAVVTFGIFIALQGTLDAGLFQRAFVGTCLLWLLLTAIELRNALRTE